MSVTVRLAALARGDATAADVVLHNCRTAAFGAAAFGREESAALFRAMPLMLDVAGAVATSALVALFGRDAAGEPAALFADVYGDHAMRLWVLGAQRQAVPLPDETGVPIDLDRDQRGGTIRLEPGDFPDLAAAAADRLRRLSQHWIDAQPAGIVGPLERVRPILLRAATVGERTAALFVLQGHAGLPGLARFAVGALLDGEPAIVVDDAGRAADLARRRTAALRPVAATDPEPIEPLP